MPPKKDTEPAPTDSSAVDVGYGIMVAVHGTAAIAWVAIWLFFAIRAYDADWNFVKQVNTNEISSSLLAINDHRPVVPAAFSSAAAAAQSTDRCPSSPETTALNCHLASIPHFVQYRNTATNIWPGASLHRDFILFILAAMGVLFSVAKVPIFPFGDKNSVQTARVVIVSAKALIYGCILMATLWITLFLQLQHNVSLSSVMLGFFFLSITVYYVILDYCKTEAYGAHACSAFYISWGSGTVMQMYYVRCLAMSPLVWLVTIIEVNPMVPRHVLVLLVVLCACTVVCMLGLERKAYLLNRNTDSVEKRSNPFHSEKLVYLVAAILLSCTHLFVAANAYDSLTIASTANAAPAFYAHIFKALVYTKFAEYTLHLLFFSFDELQTFFAPANLAEVTDGVFAFEMLRRFANVRYILFTCVDLGIVFALSFGTFQNGNVRPMLLPTLPGHM